MADEQNVSRRDVLTGALAMAASLGMPPVVARAMQAAKDPAAAAADAAREAANAEPVNLAWIGTGVQGRNDMTQLSRLPGVKFVAIADIYQPSIDEALKITGPGCEVYTDYRKLLERKDIQGVGIATPLYLHAPIAIDALNAGKAVYCEKMMAYTVEDAKKMVRTADRTGKILQIGHQRRYSPDYHHALDLIKKGYFGEITHVRAQWNRNGSWRRAVPDPKEVGVKFTKEELEHLLNWRLYKDRSRGLMAELGSHQIDVTNWFMGMHPISVVGIGGLDTYKDGRNIYDNVQCIFEYPNGLKLTYQSIQTNAFDDYTEQFMGRKGTLITSEAPGKSMMFQEAQAELAFAKFSQNKTKVGGKEAILLDAGATTKQDKRQRTAGQTLAGSGISKNNWALALEDWVDCIRKNRKPFCDARIGLADTVCVLASLEAMEKGTRVHISEEMFQV
ncbi:MAG TPA: Gfo/Idh/MocA family oxidoreductase [Armatimonadota bacterium]|nr:Gfo/Idh/MocA family oxidoreductase [Armatimonadota bacterium]